MSKVTQYTGTPKAWCDTFSIIFGRWLMAYQYTLELGHAKQFHHLKPVFFLERINASPFRQARAMDMALLIVEHLRAAHRGEIESFLAGDLQRCMIFSLLRSSTHLSHLLKFLINDSHDGKHPKPVRLEETFPILDRFYGNVLPRHITEYWVCDQKQAGNFIEGLDRFLHTGG